MSLTAIILVVISAAIHAGWNLLTKSKEPSTSFFLIASVTGVLVLSPVPVIYRHAIAHIPGKVWLMLVATSAFMAMYYTSLAGAYRAGHMSVAYPLARSSPIIVVSAVTFILGRGHEISGLCVAGIVLVVAGCFLLPMLHFSDIKSANYFNATCGLALLAAIGTAGYSIFDDEALRCMRTTPALALGTIPATLLYAFMEGLLAALWLAAIAAVRRSGPDELRRELRTNARHAAITGIGIWAGYVLILVSLAFVKNVSYVAAFRQLSIPLGTALGIVVLGEPAGLPKIAGAVVIFLGLMLVAVG